jgi:NADH:ubiquinone oxidoreductase subunit B-like Fe-S oxidoreductase
VHILIAAQTCFNKPLRSNGQLYDSISDPKIVILGITSVSSKNILALRNKKDIKIKIYIKGFQW